MMKLMISLYIVVILLIAGMAHADETNNGISFSRLNNASQVAITVNEVGFSRDAHNSIEISGMVPSECVNTLKPIVRISKAGDVFISMHGSDKACLGGVADHAFTQKVDLFEYFHGASVDPIHVEVDNVNGEIYAFDYQLAL